MIKIYGFLDIMWHLDSMLVFGGISLSLSRKYLEYTDKILRILGEAPFPLPPESVEELIVSLICGKGDIYILLDGLHSPPCLFSIILD